MEPEAAAMYVKHLPVEKRLEGELGDVFKTFSPGSKYIVVDAGGMHVRGVIKKFVTGTVKFLSLNQFH